MQGIATLVNSLAMTWKPKGIATLVNSLAMTWKPKGIAALVLLARNDDNHAGDFRDCD